MNFCCDHLSSSGQIKLAGCFSGQSALSFLPAARRALPAYANNHLVINMADVESIDTIGVGAMLVLNRDALSQATVIHVKSCRQKVRDAFLVADLGQRLRFE